MLLRLVILLVFYKDVKLFIVCNSLLSLLVCCEAKEHGKWEDVFYFAILGSPHQSSIQYYLEYSIDPKPLNKERRESEKGANRY